MTENALKIEEKTEDSLETGWDQGESQEKPLKRRKTKPWANIYGAGYDFREKLSKEFQQAIDVWEDVVETRSGQIDFIRACKNLEKDAVNYLFYRANGRLVKAFKRSTTFTGKSRPRDEVKEDYHEFFSLIYERTISDTRGINFDDDDDEDTGKVDTRGKGPFLTFNLSKITSGTDIIPAFIGWCGMYFDTYADQMRIKSKAGGITKYGSNDVTITQSHVAGQGSDEDTEIERVRKVDGSYADVDSSRYQGLDHERPVEEEYMDDALDSWKRFCREPLLKKALNKQVDKGYSFGDLFKDFLLGEKLTSASYLKYFEEGAPGISGKLAKCNELLQKYFSDEVSGLTKDDLYKLLRSYTIPELVKFLPVRSYEPTLAKAS